MCVLDEAIAYAFPLDIHGVMRPGLMLSQNWRPIRTKVGETLRALESALEFPFFTEYQTVDIADAAERRAFAETLRTAPGALTCSFGRLYYEEEMNLSSLDDVLLRRSRDLALRHLDVALETGAQYVQLVSGGAPQEPARRKEALRSLEASLGPLVERAASLGLILVIEPLDVHAHKKCTLGFTEEALQLVQHIDNPAFRLCVDTAHMKLNGEHMEDWFPNLQPIAHEFHFANCVCDPKQPLYGDRHLPIGPPGWLDVPMMARLLSCGVEAGFWAASNRARTFWEIRRPDTLEPQDVAVSIQSALEQAWKLAREGESSHPY